MNFHSCRTINFKIFNFVSFWYLNTFLAIFFSMLTTNPYQGSYALTCYPNDKNEIFCAALRIL